MAWFTLLSTQKEGSPQIKLTTLLVSKGWLFLTLCTAGSAGSGNCNNFLHPFTLPIPGLVTGWQRGRVVKGEEEAHSSSRL